jgi:hypothetical protein
VWIETLVGPLANGELLVVELGQGVANFLGHSRIDLGRIEGGRINGQRRRQQTPTPRPACQPQSLQYLGRKHAAAALGGWRGYLLSHPGVLARQWQVLGRSSLL